MHVRDQILDALVVCVTGLPTTGSRVFDSFEYPFQREELPGLNVKFHDATESSQPVTMPAPRRYEHRCRVQIVGNARASAERACRLVLGAICVEVQKALAMPTAVGPWKILTILGSQINLSSAGEKIAGQAILTYEALYQAYENAPDVAL